jgi:hypothetical protein
LMPFNPTAYQRKIVAKSTTIFQSADKIFAILLKYFSN